ncbi:acyltransferase [Actinoplanes sp. NPDC049316]|uniref:acyltransferase family protein n=1 Tax=Actinoplanes sp. NPDC049316 TaxID=3154727 RepID=UPI003431125D
MVAGAAGSTSGSALGRRDDAPARWAAGRLRYLDNLKVVLIAAIIAMHAVLGYVGSMEVWSYTEVRETTLNPVVEATLLVLITPFGLCVMTMLFLVAGLLTPGSLERKGTARYVRGRLLRLGVPFFAYVLLVQPAVMYALEHPLGNAPGSYWANIVDDEGVLDSGPLWFVGVLLIFSLGYAGWVRAGLGRAGTRKNGRITVGRLVLTAAVVAPASFLVRLIYPYGSDSGFTDLNFWQWPACLAMFGVGVSAVRHGWLTRVPERVYRQSRAVTAAAVAGCMVLLSVAGLLERIDDMMGGVQWPAVAFTAVETVLSVFGPVWMLGAAQRHLGVPLRWAGPAVARSSYGAFMVQTPVLIGLAAALRVVALPAEAKAVLVAAGAVVASFWLAWLLISRVRGVARVL